MSRCPSTGRAIALAGAIVGGILLIIDLHTKQRFYNMLRIFRPTSPMSIGTYVLMGFGFFSLVAFVVQAFGCDFIALICRLPGGRHRLVDDDLYRRAARTRPRRRCGRRTPKLLAVRFASSAMATGAAAACIVALGLALTSGLARAFGNLAALAVLVELIASLGSRFVLRGIGINGPLEELPWGPVHIVGVELFGAVIPFVLFILADFFAPAWPFSLAASICLLIGGILMRGTILLAGNELARRPQDYFRFAQG